MSDVNAAASAADKMEVEVIKASDVGVLKLDEPHPVTHPKTKFSEGQRVLLAGGLTGKILEVLPSEQYKVAVQAIKTMAGDELVAEEHLPDTPKE